MTRWSARSLLITLGGCIALIAIATIPSMMVGSTGVRWPRDSDWSTRGNPVLNAALIGAALAAAGIAYQAVLRNPLADPYLLGASSGSSLAVYLWQLPVMAKVLAVLGPLAVFGQQGLSFLGAMLAISLVLGLSGRRGRLEPVTVLLVGVIVNAVNGSIYLLLNAVVRDLPDSGGPIAFLVGGIQDIQPQARFAALSLILIGWITLLYISGDLNVAGMDSAEAEALGVRIHRLRWVALIAASLITAAAVAISGPIGFVGLVCPHIGRLIVGSDQRRLLPVATALGAILLMLADALSRLLAAEQLLATQLQVGVLTGLLGGPFFLWLLIRMRREE